MYNCEDLVNNNIIMSGNILTENNKVDSVFFTEDFSVQDNTFDPIGLPSSMDYYHVTRSDCGSKIIKSTFRPPETWNIEYTNVSHMSNSELYKYSDAYRFLFEFDNSRLFCGDVKVSDDEYFKKFKSYMRYTLKVSKNFYKEMITDEERKDAKRENNRFQKRLMNCSDIKFLHEHFSSAVKFTKGLFINGEGPLRTLSGFQKDAIEYFDGFSKAIPHMKIKIE